MGTDRVFSSSKSLMRFGIVTSSYPLFSDDTVNAGVFVREVAYGLVKAGHDVHVITPHKHGKIELSEIIAIRQIPWWGGAKDLASLSMSNPINLLRFATLVTSGIWYIGRYAKINRLDALLAMWAIPSGLFCWWTWRRVGIPYGVWALGSDIWARKKYPFGDKIVRRVLQDANFRFADGIGLSKEVEQLSGKMCKFVPSMRKLPITKDVGRIPLSPDHPHFLFIGRYEKNKGPDILIEAMRELLNKGIKAYLYMFGEGSMGAYLHQRADGYEPFIHVGEYADPKTVVAYMRACDWLVIPSRIESIPLIFIDAMQMDLPVIVSDVGDLGDLVRRFRVGIVVDIPKPQSLCDALQNALFFSPSEFSERCKDVMEIFNIDNSVTLCEKNLSLAVNDR
jgi:glycosyltransferase involved in cell wall biosynthesis